jgi:hypothetical protein
MGVPEKPVDPRAPLVTVQVVMLEVVPETPAKPGPERRLPASAESPKGVATLSALDLSASNEKILEELRKSGVRGRLDALWRISLTSADQQKAMFQFGQREPQIRGTTINQFGQMSNIEMINTGLLVEIQPRVIGEIVSIAVKLDGSRLGGAEEGVPVSVSSKGETTRVAPIREFNMHTAVNVPSGQTIVLSGMTQEDAPHKRQLMVLLCPRIVPLSPSEASRPAR